MRNKQNAAASSALSAPPSPTPTMNRRSTLPSDITPHARRRYTEQTGDDLLKAAESALVQKAIERGLAGDTLMLRYCLNRISILNTRAAAFTLPEINEVTDLTKAVAAIMTAMAARTITTQEGVHYAHLVSLLADAMRDADLSARLADLEERQIR